MVDTLFVVSILVHSLTLIWLVIQVRNEKVQKRIDERVDELHE